jgi:hypothetical protein
VFLPVKLAKIWMNEKLRRRKADNQFLRCNCLTPVQAFTDLYQQPTERIHGLNRIGNFSVDNNFDSLYYRLGDPFWIDDQPIMKEFSIFSINM